MEVLTALLLTICPFEEMYVNILPMILTDLVPLRTQGHDRLAEDC